MLLIPVMLYKTLFWLVREFRRKKYKNISVCILLTVSADEA